MTTTVLLPTARTRTNPTVLQLADALGAHLRPAAVVLHLPPIGPAYVVTDAPADDVHDACALYLDPVQIPWKAHP